MTTLDDIQHALDNARYQDGTPFSTGFKDSMMILMRGLRRLPDSIVAKHGQVDMAWLRQQDDYVLTMDFQEESNIEIELIDDSVMKRSPTMQEDMEEYALNRGDGIRGISLIGMNNAFNPEPYNIDIGAFDNGSTSLEYDDSHEELESLMTIEEGTEAYEAMMRVIDETDRKNAERKNMRDTFNDMVSDIEDDPSDDHS